LKDIPLLYAQTDGTWVLVSYEDGPNEVTGPTVFDERGVFLKHTLGTTEYFYKIVQADKENLTTILLSQGGLLSFQTLE